MNPALRVTDRPPEPNDPPVRQWLTDIDPNTPEAEPIIEGLLRRGEVCNLIAPPKTMHKSWTVANLVLAVVTGQPWLGYPTKPGKVLMVDYEIAMGTIMYRLRTVANAMKIGLDPLKDRIAIIEARDKPLTIDALQPFVTSLAGDNYNLVIIDPLCCIYPPGMDENDNAAMIGLYRRLRQIGKATQAAIVAIHHLAKGSPFGRALTDLGAGAGSQSRSTDVHMALRPHAEPDCALVDVLSRTFLERPLTCLRWQRPLWHLAPDLDPEDLWRPPRRPRKAKPEPPRLTPDLLKTIVTNTPQTAADIIAAARDLGISARAAQEALTTAVTTGILTRQRQVDDRRLFYSLPILP